MKHKLFTHLLVFILSVLFLASAAWSEGIGNAWGDQSSRIARLEEVISDLQEQIEALPGVQNSGYFEYGDYDTTAAGPYVDDSSPDTSGMWYTIPIPENTTSIEMELIFNSEDISITGKATWEFTYGIFAPGEGSNSHSEVVRVDVDLSSPVRFESVSATLPYTLECEEESGCYLELNITRDTSDPFYGVNIFQVLKYAFF